MIIDICIGASQLFQRSAVGTLNHCNFSFQAKMTEEKPIDQALPEPVRDHLGQQLRAVYTVEDGQPQFLGDDTSGIPQEFAPQIERLEKRLKTHEEGTEAVGQALDKILDAFGVSSANVHADTAPGPTARSARSGEASSR